MNTERDKRLTEAMGECWHEKKPVLVPQCIKCFKTDYVQNDFSTPDGFFKLWNWAQGQEWWRKFQHYHEGFTVNVDYFFHEDIINPDRFADAVDKFLQERGK